MVCFASTQESASSMGGSGAEVGGGWGAELGWGREDGIQNGC